MLFTLMLVASQDNRTPNLNNQAQLIQLRPMHVITQNIEDRPTASGRLLPDVLIREQAAATQDIQGISLTVD